MLDLYPDQLFAGRYSLIKQLGEGGFSQVWKAHDTYTGIDQAIKIYAGLDSQGIEIFRAEYARVNHFTHSNLLKSTYFGVAEGQPYLVMPYCQKGSTVELAGRITEGQLLQLIRDISSALAYLHRQGNNFIHKDIKPDNFLINHNGEYLLGDFGISTGLRQNFRRSLAYSSSSSAGITPPAYRGPELFQKGYEEDIIASDIWAFGASIYELATGTPPFGNMGGAIQQPDTEIPHLPQSFSRGLDQLTGHCLAYEPWNRPAAADVLRWAQEYLQYHRWPSDLLPQDTPTPIRLVASPPKPTRPQNTTKYQPWLGVALVLLVLSLSIWGIGKLTDILTQSSAISPTPTTDTIQKPSIVPDSTLDTIKPPQQDKIPTTTPQNKRRPIINPSIQEKPSKLTGNPCRVSITTIELTSEVSVFTIQLTDCNQVTVYDKKNPTLAFRIETPEGRIYQLLRVEGITTDEDTFVGNKYQFKLYFPALPVHVKEINLLEGKNLPEGRTPWNFRGISLEQ